MSFGARITVEFTARGYALLRMSNGENRINFKFIEAMHKALDYVESKRDCKALITTGVGKFYNNGMDLDWMTKTFGEDMWEKVTPNMLSLIQRMLVFPVPTVASLNGHAFAGGAVLAIAHDFRIMNSKRGWICWNEVDNGIKFPDRILQIIRSKVPPGPVLRDAITFGKRFNAQEAQSCSIVDVVADNQNIVQASEDLLARVIGQTNWQRDVIVSMKQKLYGTD